MTSDSWRCTPYRTHANKSVESIIFFQLVDSQNCDLSWRGLFLYLLKLDKLDKNTNLTNI